ncbi:MotE family protein [Desulfolithobacter sp.]
MNNKFLSKRDTYSTLAGVAPQETREHLSWRLPLFLILVLLLHSTAVSATEPSSLPTAADEPRYSSVEERRLLLSLEQERKKLAREQEAFEERKKELKTLEAEVDKKLDQLQKLKENIEKLLAEKKAEEQRRIDNLNKMYEKVSPNLSKMYEKMDPKKAATILATVDQDLAISILFRMKPKSAAKILSNMDRNKAASLTSAFPNLGAM